MSFSVCRVQWDIAEPLLRNVREKVFICEWRIPRQIEFDRQDRQAYHILICDDASQEPVATGRIVSSGEISRIAVLISHRKQSLDKVVLKGLLKVANELELDEIFIYSPLEHVDYFRSRDFYTAGAVFMEAGMPRQRMACPVNKADLFKSYLSH
ncbi:MAG: GNAT family N-acetyltransferase [Gammaproteobacteria bacterium]|nr:MAG: GNAT family N-acetyltransferase [Gammaproteobacteria bacterium]